MDIKLNNALDDKLADVTSKMQEYGKEIEKELLWEQIEIWNGYALIKDDPYFTRWVKEIGKLDHHDGFLNYLAPYLRGTMLDVGANIGTHSYHYAKFGWVHCFEPNPLAYECLQHNMKGLPRVTLHNVAVSDHAGSIDMVLDTSNYGASYTKPGTSIPTITIDSLNLLACDFIKIDVEGDELAVLRGAKETIAKCRPVMCIECNKVPLGVKGLTAEDLEALIDSLGYTHQVRQPEDISCDLLCLPR